MALGEAAWKAAVLEGAELLRAAVAAEYVVLGGGNVRLFETLPPACVAATTTRRSKAAFARGTSRELADGGRSR